MKFREKCRNTNENLSFGNFKFMFFFLKLVAKNLNYIGHNKFDKMMLNQV